MASPRINYSKRTGGETYKASAKTYQDDALGAFETTNLSIGDVSGIVEVRENNVAAIEAAFDQAFAKALEAVGLQAEGHAKTKCPVDTGRLRNSITHVVKPSELAVHIGTNVEYAEYVESGTSRQKAQPFLKPAAENHAKEYRAIVESMLKNA